MDHELVTVPPITETGERYEGLLSAARATAGLVARTPPEGLTGAARYIHGAACELLASGNAPLASADISDCAAKECLARVEGAWPGLVTGESSGEAIFADNPGLWKRAMTEWPMGNFAALAANFLVQNNLASGAILELGAGVGSCSERIAHAAGPGYIRSDLQPFLLARQRIPGTVERYDFNEPGPWSNLDAIFAVNAFHCAADKERSLSYLYNMLRPGGVLLLGEGVPYSDDRGTPWALNIFFGLFRGWWDVGGFLPRRIWIDLLEAGGFRRTGSVPWIAGKHDLGGIVWGMR